TTGLDLTNPHRRPPIRLSTPAPTARRFSLVPIGYLTSRSRKPSNPLIGRASARAPTPPKENEGYSLIGFRWMLGRRCHLRCTHWERRIPPTVSRVGLNSRLRMSRASRAEAH